MRVSVVSTIFEEQFTCELEDLKNEVLYNFHWWEENEIAEVDLIDDLITAVANNDPYNEFEELLFLELTVES